MNVRVQRPIVKNFAEAFLDHDVPHLGHEFRPSLVHLIFLAAVIDGLVSANIARQIVRDGLGGFYGSERGGKLRFEPDSHGHAPPFRRGHGGGDGFFPFQEG